MKINLKVFLYIALIIPFLKPYYFSEISLINNIYNICQCIVFLIVLIMIAKRKMKILHYTAIITAMEVLIIFSSFLNNSDYSGAIINSMQTITMCILIDYGFSKDAKKFLKYLLLILEVIVVLNFITILLFSDGINSTYMWLLGKKNTHFTIIFPTLILSVLYSYINSKKILLRTIIIVTISTISVFLLKSSTSELAICMFIFFIIFAKFFEKNSILNLKLYYIISIILFFLIIIFRLQDLFSFIIVDIIGKELSFTGRTKIWDSAIKFVKSHFILGYGNELEMFRTAKFHTIEATHCHNMILEILYQGGIFLLGLFIYLLSILEKEIKKYENTRIGKFFAWCIFIYLTVWLTEVHQFETFLWVFSIFFNINKFIDLCNLKTEENKILSNKSFYK